MITACPSCHYAIAYTSADAGNFYTCPHCETQHEYPRPPAQPSPLRQIAQTTPAPAQLSPWQIARGVFYGMLAWSLVVVLVWFIFSAVASVLRQV